MLISVCQTKFGSICSTEKDTQELETSESKLSVGSEIDVRNRSKREKKGSDNYQGMICSNSKAHRHGVLIDAMISTVFLCSACSLFSEDISSSANESHCTQSMKRGAQFLCRFG